MDSLYFSKYIRTRYRTTKTSHYPDGRAAVGGFVVLYYYITSSSSTHLASYIYQHTGNLLVCQTCWTIIFLGCSPAQVFCWVNLLSYLRQFKIQDSSMFKIWIFSLRLSVTYFWRRVVNGLYIIPINSTRVCCAARCSKCNNSAPKYLLIRYRCSSRRKHSRYVMECCTTVIISSAVCWTKVSNNSEVPPSVTGRTQRG